MKHISNRVQNIHSSGIRKFFDLVLGVEDIISLGVGEPDFVTPWHIREACIYSLERGYTSYTSNWGVLELRELIADKLRGDYGVEYDPEGEILITTGVSEGMDLVLRATINPSDEVIIPEPGYVAYKPCVILAGGMPVTIDTRIDNDFKATPEEITSKITENTKAIILNYPNNPTGSTMKGSELEEIADIAVEHDLLVISDEIYAKLTYEGTHTCFSSLNGMRNNTILLNGMSKAYAMTGWRIGYACGNREILENMMKIHQYTMLCSPITAQMAAVEALRNSDDSLRKMVTEYNRRRNLIVKGLNSIGLHCFEPKGAFYTFPSIADFNLKSEEFAERLLREEMLAVVPGNAFGNAGEGYLRCAYAVSREVLNEALSRLERFVGRLG